MNLSFKASAHREGATHFLQVEEPFHFASGGSIPAVTLAYETWGELDEARSNAVLILTGAIRVWHLVLYSFLSGVISSLMMPIAGRIMM